MAETLPTALTVSQAAQMLNVDRKTVSRHLNRGKLPGAKIGSLWRLPRTELEAYLRGEWKPTRDRASE